MNRMVYLEFDGIYGTDRTVMEVEDGLIKRLLRSGEISSETGADTSANRYQRVYGYAYPGFNDSHMHLIGLGKKLSTVDCVGCRSVDEVANRVALFIDKSANHAAGEVRDLCFEEENHLGKKSALDGMVDFNGDSKIGGNVPAWILGRGWNQDLFSDQRLPSRHDLDRVSRDIPIAIHRVCGHIAVLNTRALQEAGLMDENGGINRELIEKLRLEGGGVDIEDGELTGILREFACDVIRSDYSLPELENFVLKAQEYLFSLGITSVQTDDLYFAKNWRDVVSMFEKLEGEGRLKLSVYQQSQIKDRSELLEEYRQSKGYGLHPRTSKNGEEDGEGKSNSRALSRQRFRLGPLKILSDGSLGARTAYMTEPYADEPGTRGILAVSEEKLRELMFAAAEAGTDSAVHGIGDGAIQILLDINEEIRDALIQKNLGGEMSRRDRADESGIFNSFSRNRNTIVHCQVMSGDQIDKMAEIGIGAMVQPIFLDYDLGIIESRVGEEKARTSYAYRTMLDKGIRLAFGSDAPVEDPNPLMGIHFAVNRAEEAIELDEAIRAYTIEGAYYSYEEEIKGRLKEGYVADIAVFAQKIQRDSLKENRCIAVFISGEQVFSVDV